MSYDASFLINLLFFLNIIIYILLLTYLSTAIMIFDM